MRQRIRAQHLPSRVSDRNICPTTGNFHRQVRDLNTDEIRCEKFLSQRRKLLNWRGPIGVNLAGRLSSLHKYDRLACLDHRL